MMKQLEQNQRFIEDMRDVLSRLRETVGSCQMYRYEGDFEGAAEHDNGDLIAEYYAVKRENEQLRSQLFDQDYYLFEYFYEHVDLENEAHKLLEKSQANDSQTSSQIDYLSQRLAERDYKIALLRELLRRYVHLDYQYAQRFSTQSVAPIDLNK